MRDFSGAGYNHPDKIREAAARFQQGVIAPASSHATKPMDGNDVESNTFMQSHGGRSQFGHVPCKDQSTVGSADSFSIVGYASSDATRASITTSPSLVPGSGSFATPLTAPWPPWEEINGTQGAKSPDASPVVVLSNDFASSSLTAPVPVIHVDGPVDDSCNEVKNTHAQFSQAYKDVIYEIYAEHCPAKVGQLETLMAKYGGGNEHIMYLKICRKYGLAPKSSEEICPAGAGAHTANAAADAPNAATSGELQAFGFKPDSSWLNRTRSERIEALMADGLAKARARAAEADSK